MISTVAVSYIKLCNSDVNCQVFWSWLVEIRDGVLNLPLFSLIAMYVWLKYSSYVILNTVSNLKCNFIPGTPVEEVLYA